MYQYDESNRTIVRERAAQFRAQLERFQAEELSEEQFRQLRLRNGLYLQRHAYMLRVAIPYGLLSSRQMRALAGIARTYDRGFGHFTTRQNIQYNWPELERVPDILDELAAVEMHAIQTSGNVVRNITSDAFAGVEADEIEDPRPYCELLRQWSTLHPEFSWLPRKFKIAITGAAADRTALLYHDIGLRLVEHDGKVGFAVYVGGGMGRQPVIGKQIREFLPKRDFVSYVEAILRIYNLYGRRDNIHKARIKVLVNAMGIDEFRQAVEQEWRRIRDSALRLDDGAIERMQRFFAPPAYSADAGTDATPDWPHHTDKAFSTWARRNTRDHKVTGYRIVLVPLKAPGEAPGDATATQMDAVADLSDRYSFGRIRVTHEQNLVLADVQQGDLYALWRSLVPLGLAVPNIGTLNDMICCPGLDYCSLANAGTIPIAKQIHARFEDLDYLYDLGEIQLKMSGCMNACGHHHAGHIGILGVEKSGEEWYQITLGGSAGNAAAVGARLGPSVPAEAVAETIDRILQVYLEQREPDELFIATVRRLGVEPFKERVYADAAPTLSYRDRVAA